MRGGAGAAELAATAAAMAQALRHRGPDAQTTFMDAQAAAGFRPVAVVHHGSFARRRFADELARTAVSSSPTTARFTKPSDLRADLARRGVRFRGHSDTEVIVEACAHFGVEATLPRLIGMFAFALWDRQRAGRAGARPLRHQAALFRRDGESSCCSAPSSRPFSPRRSFARRSIATHSPTICASTMCRRRAASSAASPSCCRATCSPSSRTAPCGKRAGGICGHWSSPVWTSRWRCRRPTPRKRSTNCSGARSARA